MTTLTSGSMEGSGNNNPPTGNGSPRRGYSTVGPHHNPTGRRPRLAELDIPNTLASRSPSLAPSMPSQAGSARPLTSHAPGHNFSTGTSSLPQPTGAQPGGPLRALPQRVIDANPHLSGMTREEAWQWELNQRNQWLAALRNWIVRTQERVIREILATDTDFLCGLHDGMAQITTSLPDFENQESIAAICMEEDRLRQSRPADLKIPEFQPPMAAATPTPSIIGSFAAPSEAQVFAGSVGDGGPGPNTGGPATTTHTPTCTTLSEAPQKTRGSDRGGDGTKTPRAQNPSRTGSIHVSDAVLSQTGGSSDDLESSNWLSNDGNSNQRSRESRNTGTTASRNVNPPPSFDTPTGDTTTLDTHNSGNSNTDTNDSERYVGYYQAEEPYKLAPRGGIAAPSITNPPPQPPRQPQGPSTTNSTETTESSSPGGFGGDHQAQGSFRGYGGRRGRGRADYYRPPPIRMAHPDRPDEPLHFPRTGQQHPGHHEQHAGSSTWSSTNASNDDDPLAFPSESQGPATRHEPWGHGQGQAQAQGQARGDSQSQGWGQEKSEWEPYKPEDGKPFRNDW